jgi:hypothetical protein
MSQRDPIIVWRDPQYPEEPIRGMLVAQNSLVVVCNDFQLTFLSPDLSQIMKTLPAKEKDTCRAR